MSTMMRPIIKKYVKWIQKCHSRHAFTNIKFMIIIVHSFGTFRIFKKKTTKTKSLCRLLSTTLTSQFSQVVKWTFDPILIYDAEQLLLFELISHYCNSPGLVFWKEKKNCIVHLNLHSPFSILFSFHLHGKIAHLYLSISWCNWKERIFLTMFSFFGKIT